MENKDHGDGFAVVLVFTICIALLICWATDNGKPKKKDEKPVIIVKNYITVPMVAPKEKIVFKTMSTSKKENATPSNPSCKVTVQ